VTARAGLAALLLAGCACEGREFTLRRGDAEVTRGCAEVADTAAARAVGLTGRDAPPEGRAMWLQFPMPTEACIVNRGVRFAIDAAYVSPSGVVSAVERGFPAGDPTPRCHDGALHVIEWASATAPGVRVGDRVAW
jgi:uncharacterized membrane protein (UPF0127 family)